ncbi:MAG: hypothetical protein K0R54_5786 [Clostridiaceae bacterium]|jgi:hypothetical protein|nr:hypothetical protein [Clostridiaceae bacterium]
MRTNTTTMYTTFLQYVMAILKLISIDPFIFYWKIHKIS